MAKLSNKLDGCSQQTDSVWGMTLPLWQVISTYWVMREKGERVGVLSEGKKGREDSEFLMSDSEISRSVNNRTIFLLHVSICYRC